MEITAAAAKALVDAGTNRQGAPIPPTTATEVRRELEAAGLVGIGNGLTRKGTIAREQIVEEMLTKAFGA